MNNPRPPNAAERNVAQADTNNDGPERELLFEQPLTSGTIIKVYVESYDPDSPPSLRLEKLSPGRERPPLNFSISGRFADAFVEAVILWRGRVEETKRRVAQQAPLRQRANLGRGGR